MIEAQKCEWQKFRLLGVCVNYIIKYEKIYVMNNLNA